MSNLRYIIIMNMKNKYEKKYENIIKELIEKFFNELKGMEIRIIEVDKVKYYATALHKRKFFELRLNKAVRKFKKSRIRAMFAHELGHFVIYKKVGYILTKISDFLEDRFRFFKSLQEKSADKEAIKHGFGRIFYNLRKERRKKKPGKNKKKKSVYMTSDEIKEYMKKQEKKNDIRN